MKISKGDIVHHKDDTSITPELAIVVTTYTDISGGVRLDRRLKDFISWNQSELVKVGQLTTATRQENQTHG